MNGTDFQKIPYLSAQITTSGNNTLQEAADEEDQDENVELLGCINLNGNALYEGESMPLSWSIDNCKVLIKAKIGEE